MSEVCAEAAASATIEMDGVKIVADEDDQLPQKKHYRYVLLRFLRRSPRILGLFGIQIVENIK